VLSNLQDIAASLGIQNEHHVPFLLGLGLLLASVLARLVAANRGLALLVPLCGALRLTLPPVSSFDAKKELKRVLRKDQLPAEHPDKPKGWFEKMATKAAASVAGELLASAGYEVRSATYLGLAHVVEVDLDATGTRCRWVGAFNKFYFIGQSDRGE
jgi:hypothetical protein